jgi:hypothetical protein
MREGVIQLNLGDVDNRPSGLDEEEVNEHILGVILLHQYNLKKGLELFGEKGELATVKELKQIHDMGTYVPLEAGKLTPEMKKRALSALMFIVEKRDGRVKARKCAVGSKQRTFEEYDKHASTSPTVSTGGVFITSAIEAHEERDVATFDVPGAFLHTDNDEETIMLLKGRLAELMVQVDPQLYRKYVITSRKGEPMLYVRLSKALYGLLQSALLFYKKFVGDIEKYGFVVNPYDPCVANKTVNGSQMTVTWHVDDGKVSHKDPNEVTKFLVYLAKIYGPKLTVTRGKVHDYLGMDLDYASKKELKVVMIKYLKKVMTDFPEAITSTAATPAADHLFDIRDEEEAKWLPEEQAQAFHRSVAQLLFLSARARPDIKTAVAFLTTRVSKPDEDDWGKLKRVLKYLKGTFYLKLTLSVDDLSMIKCFVWHSLGCKRPYWYDDVSGEGGSYEFLQEAEAQHA